MGKRLDDLSRQLASGVSRRQVLKGAVGGLAAAAAATLIPGRTAAADGGGSTLGCCEVYCAAQLYSLRFNETWITFQQDFVECVRGCVNQAQYHAGPCANCGSCDASSLCLPTLLNQSTVCVPL